MRFQLICLSLLPSQKHVDFHAVRSVILFLWTAKKLDFWDVLLASEYLKPIVSPWSQNSAIRGSPTRSGPFNCSPRLLLAQIPSFVVYPFTLGSETPYTSQI